MFERDFGQGLFRESEQKLERCAEPKSVEVAVEGHSGLCPEDPGQVVGRAVYCGSDLAEGDPALQALPYHELGLVRQLSWAQVPISRMPSVGAACRQVGVSNNLAKEVEHPLLELKRRQMASGLQCAK